jgi:hypothetical protein
MIEQNFAIYFSINSFLLGTLFGSCVYFSNLIFSLLCIIYNIKIIEFSLFYHPKFSLHNERVAGTNFILGWLPLGASIKPLGLGMNEEEIIKMCESELPNAFFNKPKYQRAVFSLVPFCIYIFAFTIAFIWFANFTNLIGQLANVIDYMIEAFTTMFSGDIKNGNFIATTKAVIANKNIVLFSTMLLTFVILLLTPLTAIMKWFINEEKNHSQMQNAVGFTLTIAICWLILWKIPKFIFYFFSFSQSVRYVSSFIVGIFSTCLVCYFTTFFITKICRNKLK